MWKFLSMLALIAMCLCSSSWAEAPGFTLFVFDGVSFKESRAEGTILVRDGMLPQLAGEGGVREDPLPAGTGAVALLCYLQSSGGKLRSHSRVVPMPGIAVSVRGAGVTLATRTNEGGYVILALPSGSYEFRLFGFTKKVVVEPGKTVLVSIRGGKRMVD